MPKFILRPRPTGPGEWAHEIHDSEAARLIKEGRAIMLPDGILREVADAPPVKKVVEADGADEPKAEYETKVMKPKGRPRRKKA